MIPQAPVTFSRDSIDGAAHRNTRSGADQANARHSSRQEETNAHNAAVTVDNFTNATTAQASAVENDAHAAKQTPHKPSGSGNTNSEHPGPGVFDDSSTFERAVAQKKREERRNHESVKNTPKNSTGRETVHQTAFQPALPTATRGQGGSTVCTSGLREGLARPACLQAEGKVPKQQKKTKGGTAAQPTRVPRSEPRRAEPVASHQINFTADHKKDYSVLRAWLCRVWFTFRLLMTAVTKALAQGWRADAHALVHSDAQLFSGGILLSEKQEAALLQTAALLEADCPLPELSTDTNRTAEEDARIRRNVLTVLEELQIGLAQNNNNSAERQTVLQPRAQQATILDGTSTVAPSGSDALSPCSLLSSPQNKESTRPAGANTQKHDQTVQKHDPRQTVSLTSSDDMSDMLGGRDSRRVAEETQPANNSDLWLLVNGQREALRCRLMFEQDPEDEEREVVSLTRPLDVFWYEFPKGAEALSKTPKFLGLADSEGGATKAGSEDDSEEENRQQLHDITELMVMEEGHDEAGYIDPNRAGDPISSGGLFDYKFSITPDQTALRICLNVLEGRGLVFLIPIRRTTGTSCPHIGRGAPVAEDDVPVLGPRIEREAYAGFGTSGPAVGVGKKVNPFILQTEEKDGSKKPKCSVSGQNALIAQYPLEKLSHLWADLSWGWGGVPLIWTLKLHVYSGNSHVACLNE